MTLGGGTTNGEKRIGRLTSIQQLAAILEGELYI